MNNENVSFKKKIFGAILDVITIGFLFAAFGMLFYLVFIAQRSDMKLEVLAAITVVGLTLLFLVGTVSTMVTKVKNHSLTAGSLAFSAVQLYALISNFVALGCLLINLCTVEDTAIRVTYGVTVAIVLIGYVVNVISMSNGVLDDSEQYVEDTEEESSDEAEALADDDAEVLTEADEEDGSDEAEDTEDTEDVDLTDEADED